MGAVLWLLVKLVFRLSMHGHEWLKSIFFLVAHHFGCVVLLMAKSPLVKTVRLARPIKVLRGINLSLVL